MTDNKVFQRRTEKEKYQAGDYFSGSKRYYDQVSEVTVVKVVSGDCYVTNRPGEMMMTILGSCVSACIRDPKLEIGGMNHFLLPESKGVDSSSARFGAYAMEELINGILKLGGDKSRLEVKVFGGGNVIESSAKIGHKNVEFVRDYLKKEGLKIVSEDLGGSNPRRVHYYPDSGKVMMRALQRAEDFKLITEEEKTYKTIIDKKTDISGDVELF